jgi:hypothetical protein
MRTRGYNPLNFSLFSGNLNKKSGLVDIVGICIAETVWNFNPYNKVNILRLTSGIK